MDRRLFLRALTGTACSLAAHPLMTTVTLAGSDGGTPLGDQRLVVVILRGAMDGLDLLRPVSDPLFARYRPTLSATPSVDLADGFALNGTVAGLLPLWKAGQLGFVSAVSTPYRDRRSHFDGQDILEAGTGLDVPDGAVRDGWLNRMLQAMPGLTAQTAFAVGTDSAPVLHGAAPVSNWQPNLRLDLSSQSRLLLDHIYHDDPLFREAAAEALMLTESMEMAAPDMAEADPMMQPASTSRRLADTDRLIDFAADRLRADTRIAAFSLTGWDTHRNQHGGITAPLARLERVILRLQAQLGPQIWDKTLLLAMTEFGRTVAENGTKGTDHGTGGTMVMAGGALNGGRILGRWPGLDEASLYDRRDLMPTSDVRAWAAWGMRGLYGLDRGLLEGSIFPGLQMGDDPGLLA